MIPAKLAGAVILGAPLILVAWAAPAASRRRACCGPRASSQTIEELTT
jgi:hypothetical protein